MLAMKTFGRGRGERNGVPPTFIESRTCDSENHACSCRISIMIGHCCSMTDRISGPYLYNFSILICLPPTYRTYNWKSSQITTRLRITDHH